MRFNVRTDKLSLLVIDMTNAFVEKGSPLEDPGSRKIIRPIKALIKACHENSVPVIFANHCFRRDGLDRGLMFDFYPVLKEGFLYDGARGTHVISELKPIKGDFIVKKSRYSAFYNTELDSILRGLGRDTLIICGTSTEFCCESTARDAFYRDYKVLFLSDANATESEMIQRATLATISRGFGQVLTTEEMIGLISGKRRNTKLRAS
ncbi:MAG TPA: isochorismatase family cysteine hydrolase [Nitrososphaerales archaeon]|nr:isochorismatase family cysteine hydrolase [Nitrososphaerales archaeon]